MTNQETKAEQKSQRFNMFMSPSEMQAIDEWAWEHKIRSKSEAVRRLCQIALSLEPLIMEAKEAAKLELDASIAIFKEIRPFQSEVNQADTLQEDVKRKINYMSELLVRSLEANSYYKVVLAAEVLEALKSGETVEQGMAEAKAKINLDKEIEHIFSPKK